VLQAMSQQTLFIYGDTADVVDAVYLRSMLRTWLHSTDPHNR